MGEGNSKEFCAAMPEFRGYAGTFTDPGMGQGNKVLSYGDCMLYEDDVKLLEPRGWINDKIVGFSFEYFDKQQFKDISKDICFIAPEVALFLKLCQGRDKSEIDNFLSALELEKKEYIIIAVNDTMSLEQPGGSHWSTLVYSKRDNKLVHLDSFGGYNGRHAEMLRRKIGMHLEAFERLPITPVRCPQQTNVVDCGIYAICLAEEVCHNIKNKKSDIFDVSFDVPHISATRERLKRTIRTLAAM